MIIILMICTLFLTGCYPGYTGEIVTDISQVQINNCLSLNNYVERADCLTDLAELEQDETICNLISDDYMRSRCYEKVK